ncbi:hypothetical protein PZE06_07165 [Robertmurraya sp. DFI.2.37]|uniref:hypothetical protein n=1 Tax=Robertmurraya sp. DFI.2.37 TaxID=3031819 RepID=UPI0012440B44|nr:hypothetical protein [Robertmurraya sp. DFI.2.37]MDF1507962.1 hypothetical protein [Robertmurraya sp. DFI.2.37]
MTNKDNPVAKALFVVGVLIILFSAVSGLLYGTSSDDHFFLGELQTTIGWSMFISGIICGLIFLGFSEIIKLLQGIYNQNEKAALAPLVEQENHSSPVTEPVKSIITAKVTQEIEQFYQAKNLKVVHIEETNEEDFFKVTLDNGHINWIELGGFKPIIHSEKE